MPNPEVSIIIPVKNEVATIGDLVTELRAQLPDAQLLVIDDGSTDDSPTAAREAGAEVFSHRESLGNGAAIKSGVRLARGETLLMMDGDGQHRADEAARMLFVFKERGLDLLVGARPPRAHASRARRLANLIYNGLASTLSGHRISDLTSGMRVARANRFREFLSLLPNGFSYPTTSTMAFLRSGYQVDFEPIRCDCRQDTNSHIRPLKDGMRFLVIILRIGSLYSPLKLFLPISLALFVTATLLYAYTFLSQGRFTNMSALLFTTSLLTFLIGMVSEQITNLIFMTVAKNADCERGEPREDD